MARKQSARAVLLSIEARGVKELKATFADLVRASDPALPRLRYAGENVQDAYRRAAIVVRDKARSNAQASGSPRRLYGGSRPAIFAFSDFDATRDSKRSRSAMVGVRTGLSARAKDENLYVRWFYGSRRKDGSRADGGLSMSLGALFERGRKDRRIRPKRYFRGAIFGTRGTVLRILRAAYEKALAIVGKQ
jgi:hypothetical protein